MINRHSSSGGKGKKMSGFQIASLKVGEGLVRIGGGKKIEITKEQLVEFGLQIKKANESNI